MKTDSGYHEYKKNIRLMTYLWEIESRPRLPSKISCGDDAPTYAGSVIPRQARMTFAWQHLRLLIQAHTAHLFRGFLAYFAYFRNRHASYVSWNPQKSTKSQICRFGRMLPLIVIACHKTRSLYLLRGRNREQTLVQVSTGVWSVVFELNVRENSRSCSNTDLRVEYSREKHPGWSGELLFSLTCAEIVHMEKSW